jgi:Zn-finger nucleic acid-binding protein
VKFEETVEVARCDVCAGLWCKPDALDKMRAVWMAEAVLDTGDPAVGRRLDKVDDIDCPEGHGPLEKCDDDEQEHIWYERCSTCGGMFLDAGELTDLKYDTFYDWFKGWLKGPRPGA